MIGTQDREDIALLSAYQAGRRDVLDAVEDELRRLRSWAIASPPSPGYRVIVRLRQWVSEMRESEAPTASGAARPRIDARNHVTMRSVAASMAGCQEE